MDASRMTWTQWRERREKKEEVSQDEEANLGNARYEDIGGAICGTNEYFLSQSENFSNFV